MPDNLEKGLIAAATVAALMAPIVRKDPDIQPYEKEPKTKRTLKRRAKNKAARKARKRNK